ncbi:hypothetical protein EH183_30415 [Streptomyces sp. CB01881]|nr:hypothetical protein EH183_30415 [Streptomyces sp. CB01881]
MLVNQPTVRDRSRPSSNGSRPWPSTSTAIRRAPVQLDRVWPSAASITSTAWIRASGEGCSSAQVSSLLKEWESEAVSPTVPASDGPLRAGVSSTGTDVTASVTISVQKGSCVASSSECARAVSRSAQVRREVERAVVAGGSPLWTRQS